MAKNKIAIFEGNQIRREWDDKKEKWYFSVIDVIKALTGSTIPKRYWSDLKIKLREEGSEVYEKIVQLKKCLGNPSPNNGPLNTINKYAGFKTTIC
jgi:hypothetical protein